MSPALGAATSIRRRLLLLLLPTLLALTLAGAFVNHQAALFILRAAYDQRLGDRAIALAARMRTGSAAPEVNNGARGFESEPGRDGTIRYAVRDPGHALLAGDPTVLPCPPGSANPCYGDARIDGASYRVATYRLRTERGILTVSAAEPSALRAAPGHFVFASTWLVDFIQVDVTLLIVWIAVHYALKPLIAVRRQIESRSPRELQPLQAAGVPAEVRPLVDALNLLFDLLREAARSQRQFVADTAHQLRTPLAGLNGQLELLMHDEKSAPMRERLAALHEGMSRLAHSANQLLALARADPSASLAERLEPVDLKELVGRTVELNVSRAAASGHDLGVEAESATVSGSARLLEDLLANLLDNALTYTPRGSGVTVRCGLAQGAPFLEVEDDGPGIPEAERAHVRRRFYRLPGTKGRGCGLGLAIVEEIARLHRAALTIEEGAGGRGTRARVQFVAAETSGRARRAADARPETANSVAF